MKSGETMTCLIDDDRASSTGLSDTARVALAQKNVVEVVTIHMVDRTLLRGWLPIRHERHNSTIGRILPDPMNCRRPGQL